jgi:hypothetical protein
MRDDIGYSNQAIDRPLSIEAIKRAYDYYATQRRLKMNDKSFYVVWNPGDRCPLVRHTDLDAARTEAKRLATLNPGVEFFILRAVEGVEYREDPWRRRSFCAK